MSLSVKTQGGGGGFWPSIFVTGLSETNTVYATMGSKTVSGKWGTRTIDETEVSGFLISPLRELGTWTITATDGEKTATREVLVDVAAEFTVEMFYGFYTDFAEKQSDWTEEGGTFNFGDGLHVNEGAMLPTITEEGTRKGQYLTIPYAACSLWTLEFPALISCTSGDDAGGLRVYLVSADDSELLYFVRSDNWGYGDYDQAFAVYVGGDSKYSSGKVSNMNGVTQNVKLTYDGSTLTAYVNNAQVYSGTHSLDAVAGIKIGFFGYTGSPLPYLQISELKLITRVTT